MLLAHPPAPPLSCMPNSLCIPSIVEFFGLTVLLSLIRGSPKTRIHGHKEGTHFSTSLSFFSPPAGPNMIPDKKRLHGWEHGCIRPGLLSIEAAELTADFCNCSHYRIKQCTFRPLHWIARSSQAIVESKIPRVELTYTCLQFGSCGYAAGGVQ